jgi:predicted nucleic acid-binding protein
VLKRIVIDAGPLIALFDKDDDYHKKAISFIKKFRGELITNYAVITEVTHLLDFSIKAQCNFLRWIINDGLTISEIENEDLSRILELTLKYSDLPMDFADASLVVLCERLKIKEIASIDKDFGIYRTQDKKSFRNIFLY